MSQNPAQELLMKEDDFIVSKTDAKGKITYGNRTFIQFSGYDENDLLNQPHNLIRHPDMPRAVFRRLWNTLQQGKEFFGLIKNRSKTGQYYWTFAHVTPSFDENGNLLGYHSVRRCPRRDSINLIDPIYRHMCQLEAENSNAKEAMDASTQYLDQQIAASGKSYHEFVLTLEK